MSDEKNDQKKKTVVIVGSGVGSQVATGLVKTLDPSRYSIVLINPRPFHILLPATVRMLTTSTDELEKTALVPLDKLFPPNGVGSVKQGKVVGVEADKKEVVLADGERVAYDVLVLGTGSVWPEEFNFPEEPDRIPDHLAHWRGQIKDAKSVTIVGGGAVGVEFAGEIKEFYPKTKVTIVHGQEALLNSTYPTKFRKAFESRLKARGVEIIYNDYIESIPSGPVTSVTTKKGKTIETDLVIPAFGAKPNTSFLPADFLNQANYVKVRPTLQTAAHDDIFAAGDIIDWAEQKQAAKNAGHAAVVAKNVKAVLEGRKPTAVYKGTYEIILVTVGKTGGAAYFGVLWGLVFGDWFARMLKSKDLMVPMSRGFYNYK